MSISLASESPVVEHKGSRANFRWSIAEPWDERRLAAFLMTKHRRNDADWERRASPFHAALGMTAVERMFLSIFLFMNVCVLGLALLLATNRLVF